MAGYNKLERHISKFLSSFPKVKGMIKRIYAAINLMFYKKDFVVNSKFKNYKIALEGKESFFGYYDKSPDNGNGIVIFHSIDGETSKKVDNSQSVDICIYDLERGFIVDKLSSNAYNWQQGTRLHWLTPQKFIYNDYDSKSDNYISKVYDIQTKAIVREFECAVQDSYKDEYFLSLNYKRLAIMRPDYGYFSHFENSDLKETYNDGVWKVDMATGKSKLIISIADVCKFEFMDMPEYTHKLNHFMISPKGDQFIFLHRYLEQGVRKDRLLLASSEGKFKKVISEGPMVSHMNWLDNNNLIGYLAIEGKIGYFKIDVLEGKYIQLEGDFSTLGDGHPSVDPKNNHIFISDSYPDKSRMQTLWSYNIPLKKYSIIGQYYHPLKYDLETRCDLHPRFSVDGNYIFFDSLYSGKRALHYVDYK